jgi:hypothetical protein
MIEFKGEITSKNAIDSQGRMLKKVLIICSIAAMLFMLVLLGANSFFRILILTFIPITMIVMVIIPNKYMAFLPERLFVDLDERTIVSQKSGTGETFKMLDDVTKVEDFGDYYAFYFNNRVSGLGFVAQKDLITQGTIEEFEEIFKEVLVRVK